jgi:uncharacterized protein (TIGR00251 family)
VAGTLVLTDSKGGITFSIRVTPRAKRNQVVGVANGALKVSVTAPPEDGRANDAVIELLAAWLGIKRRQIEIVSGATNRNKVIRVTEIARKDIVSRLASIDS